VIDKLDNRKCWWGGTKLALLMFVPPIQFCEVRNSPGLPIDHGFEIDNGDLQVQLEKSTRLLGELNAMARMVPDIDLFIMSFLQANHLFVLY
jgi:hypothetical protein